jgi:hypothetical protein
MEVAMSTQSISVCDEVQSALQASPLFDLRELKVADDGRGCIVIRGMVGSFYHKQLAQEAVRAVVKKLDYKVVNYVEVIDSLTN